MENLFILLIILIFIFRGLARLIERTSKAQRQEPPPSPEEIKEYFESIGLPSPPTPKPKGVEEPAVSRPVVGEEPEEKITIPLDKIKKEETPTVETLQWGTPLKEKSLHPLLRPLSGKTLKQGIILSAILGPPKAFRARRFLKR